MSAYDKNELQPLYLADCSHGDGKTDRNIPVCFLKGKPRRITMFSKKHSTMTKGILIIFMLAHHAFYPDQLNLYEVRTLFDNPVRVAQIVSFLRICVAGFSFLSAYGITRILKNNPSENVSESMNFILKRLIKLESSAVFIYIFAALYRQFVMGQPLSQLYAPVDMDVAHIGLCMFIDGLGLAQFMNTPLINVTWWYLSYAILLIAIMPFFFKAYEKFRYSLLPTACMIPLLIPLSRMEFWHFLPTAFLGCAFAYENWFERLRDWKSDNKIIKTGKFFACLFLFYLSYLLSKYVGLEFSSMLVFVIPYTVYEFIVPLPGLNFCLEFLGKHATNIFLTHTFLYYYFYSDFIYSFRDSWKILSVLLGISLALSILIELFKKYSGYNKLTAKILQLVSFGESLS